MKRARAFFLALVHSFASAMSELSTLFERISKVRLRGGVVGRISHVLIFACVSIAIIAAAVHTFWVSIVGLITLFLLCFPMLWRMVTLAERNPHAALFEGAEFLAHEQMRLGTKEQPFLPPSTSQPPMQTGHLIQDESDEEGTE